MRLVPGSHQLPGHDKAPSLIKSSPEINKGTVARRCCTRPSQNAWLRALMHANVATRRYKLPMQLQLGPDSMTGLPACHAFLSWADDCLTEVCAPPGGCSRGFAAPPARWSCVKAGHAGLPAPPLSAALSDAPRPAHARCFSAAVSSCLAYPSRRESCSERATCSVKFGSFLETAPFDAGVCCFTV